MLVCNATVDYFFVLKGGRCPTWLSRWVAVGVRVVLVLLQRSQPDTHAAPEVVDDGVVGHDDVGIDGAGRVGVVQSCNARVT